MKGELKKKKQVQTTGKKDPKKLVKTKVSSTNTKRPLVLASKTEQAI